MQLKQVRHVLAALLFMLISTTRLNPPCATTNATRSRSTTTSGTPRVVDMDWTGGTKRRYAGAKSVNAARQRQKAHFARTRAAMNGTTSTNRGRHPSSTAFRIASSRAERRDNQPFRSHSRGSTRASPLRPHPKKPFSAHNDDRRPGPTRQGGTCE